MTGDRLLTLLKRDAYRKGEYTLSSGRKSEHYVNCKPVTLSGEGLSLVCPMFLECIDQDAANYNNEANQDDGSCLYDINYVNDAFNDGVNSVECPPCDNDCPGDYTGDGLVSVGDLLEFLILFGNQCE